MVGDQLRDDLGIGVALEFDAVTLELAFERGVVFDDAVVDHGDQAIAAKVRMGVAIVGGTMRGPAGMADADTTGGRLVAQQAHQILNAASPFAQMEAIAGESGYAGAVVAPIFQPMESLNQKRLCFPGPGIADNSAHAYSSLNGSAPSWGAGALRNDSRKSTARDRQPTSPLPDGPGRGSFPSGGSPSIANP